MTCGRHGNANLRCMIHHVARAVLSQNSPFLAIFQKAAARAYTRVQRGSSRANAFRTGLDVRSSRKSFDPITHPRCAFPKDDRFLHFDSVPSRNVKFASPRRLSGRLQARYRLVGDYSPSARAESAPLLPVFSDIPSHQSLDTGDASNKESFANSPFDSLEHAPTSSTAPPLILPKVHDDTPQSSVHHGRYSLSRRLLRLYMSSPHLSIQSLISYHNTFPDQQSSRSYNLLLRLA